MCSCGCVGINMVMCMDRGMCSCIGVAGAAGSVVVCVTVWGRAVVWICVL